MKIHFPFKKSSLLGVLAVFSIGLMALVAQTSDPSAPPILGQTSTKTTVQKIQLGVRVSKPVAAVYAQLPKLPRGSGFVLQSVTAGGTADAAGLKPMDVIWKLGDQILINESQLMILLSHHRPGDKVQVSYFHSGQEKETTLELQGGIEQPPIPGMTSQMPPFPSSLRVISYEDRSASISDKNGTATLTFREGKPWLHIESSHGEETYNGRITKSAVLAKIPITWRSRLPILQRSLEASVRLRRLPRVRHVPRPKRRIAGGEKE